MIITFHGSDHKSGVSQTARGFAECLAAAFKYKKILLIHTDRAGSSCCPGVRESLADVRPYLREKMMDAEELAGRARLKDNLYIIGGDPDPESGRRYLPDMSEYMLTSFAKVFEYVICDSGSDAEYGLCLGSLLAADMVFMVLCQSEICLRRAEWLKPLYDKLSLKDCSYVLCKYDKNSPYDPDYVEERLGLNKGSLLYIRKSRHGEDAELENRSIYSFSEPGYRKDIALLASKAAGADITAESGKKLWKIRKERRV